MCPEPDRTCKRCSVTRVNALVRAYRKAHEEKHEATLRTLREIERLVARRGYAQGTGIVRPGLSDKPLRSLCWNVSSFLEDAEVERLLGVRL